MAGDGNPRKNSWKATAHARRAKSPLTRWIGRFLITLLAAALLSLLVWLFILLLAPEGGSKLIAIHPEAADAGQTSWMPPFAKQDCQALEKIENLPAKVIRVNPEGFGSALSKNINELNCEKKDMLIVYLTGVGIVHGQKACIVCRDAGLRSAVEGIAAEELVEVGKLLKQLGGCPGKKLLILDVASLGNDPRLGILVNDFPLRLEQEVKANKVADVWILNSAAMFQVGHVLYSQQRSLFGKAVEEGLEGLADSNGHEDGKVRLLEFYDYVIRRCMGPAPADEGAAGQTPMLMHGSPGIVDSDMRSNREGKDSDDPILIRIATSANSEKKQPAKEKKAAPAGPAKSISRAAWRAWQGISPGGQLAAQTVEAPAEKSRSADSPVKDSPRSESPGNGLPGNGLPGNASPGKGQDPKSQQPDAAAAVVAADQAASILQNAPQNLKSLLAAWRLRDNIQNRQFGEHRSPVDFGPHHWRHLNARLLAIEQGLLAAPDSTEDLRSLDDIFNVLDELKSAMQGSRPGTKFLDEAVIKAWNQFHNGRVVNQHSPANGPVAVLQQEYADLFWQSIFVVRWYDFASLTDSGRSAGDPALPIKQFLAELAKFGRTIEMHLGNPTDRTLPQNEIDKLTSDCNGLKRQRQRILETIDGDISKATGLLKEEGASDGLEGNGRIRAERLAADLLSTPLLRAEQRMVLYAILRPGDQLRGVAAAGSAEARTLPEARWPSGEQTRNHQWSRLQDRTELQIGLISLAGGEQADRPANNRFWEKIANIRPANSEQLAKLLEEYHEFGREIAKSLADLSREIPVRKSDPYHAWRLAQLADPRDNQVHGGTQVVLDWDLRVRQNRGTIRLGSDNSVLPVFEDDSTPLVVSAENWPQSEKQVAVVLRYDQERLEVSTPDGRPIRVDQQLLIPLAEDKRKGEVVLKLKWKGPGLPSKDARQTVISAQVVTGNELASPVAPAELICEHRGSRPIELVIRRHGKGKPVVPKLAPGGGRATLETFPGRATWFDFALVSKVPHEINLQVQILAVPGPATALTGSSRERGRLGKPRQDVEPGALKPLLFDKAGECKKELVIAVAAQDGKQPFPLPAAAKNLRLSFMKRPEPAAPAGGTPAPDKPKTPEANNEPPLPANWDGHRLACVISTDIPEWKWIYVLDLELLDPQTFLETTVEYNRPNQRIDVGLAVPDFADFSDLIADLAKNPFHIDLNRKGEISKGDIGGDLPDAELHLAWEAEPDGLSREFEIDVRGYPRAFRYRILCENDQKGEKVLPREPGVRIRSVQAADGSKMKYVVDGFAASAKPGAAPATAVPITIALSEKDEWAAFPAESENLRVVVAVDPRFPHDDSTLHVRLENSGKAFSPGRHEGGGAEYRPRVDDGVFAIFASVKEHEFSIPVGVKGTGVYVVAELISGVDGDEPAVASVPVVVGPRKLDVELSISDQSGRIPAIVAGKEVRLSVRLKGDETTGMPQPNAGIKRVVISIKGEDDKIKELKEEDGLAIPEKTKFPWIAKWKVAEKFPAQTIILIASVTDGLGQENQVKLPLAVKSPAGKATTGSEKGDTKKGAIRVSRQYRGNAIEDLNLEPPDRPPVPSKDQKYWEFTDLELDQGYTVTAVRIHDGMREELTSERDVKPTADKPKLVILAPKKDAVPKRTP